VRSIGVIANRLESVRKLVHKLAPVGRLRACYEAGPTGCVLYGQLAQLGVAWAPNGNARGLQFDNDSKKIPSVN
jgi:hypothetical protein